LGGPRGGGQAGLWEVGAPLLGTTVRVGQNAKGGLGRGPFWEGVDWRDLFPQKKFFSSQAGKAGPGFEGGAIPGQFLPIWAFVLLRASLSGTHSKVSRGGGGPGRTYRGWAQMAPHFQWKACEGGKGGGGLAGGSFTVAQAFCGAGFSRGGNWAPRGGLLFGSRVRIPSGEKKGPDDLPRGRWQRPGLNFGEVRAISTHWKRGDPLKGAVGTFTIYEKPRFLGQGQPGDRGRGGGGSGIIGAGTAMVVLFVGGGRPGGGHSQTLPGKQNRIPAIPLQTSPL